MKSTLTLALSLVFSFFFICSAIQAQSTVSANVLLGAWYYTSATDTIVLSKNNNNNLVYQQWIFKQSGKFIHYSKTKGKFAADVTSQGDTWLFDNATQHLTIKKANITSRFYKVVAYQIQTIKFVKIN